MKKLILAGCALLLIGAGSVLNADLYVSLITKMPEDIAILATLNPNNIPVEAKLDSTQWRKASTTGSNNIDLAMSFIAQESGTLNVLGMYISLSEGGGGGEFSLTIREKSDQPSGNDGNTKGDILASLTGTISVGTAESGILQFEFTGDDAVSLTAGMYYTVTFVWLGEASSAKRFGFVHSTLPTDADENVISFGGWHKQGHSTT